MFYMRKHVLTVNVLWDEEAKVYVATSEDIPGLVTEAETFEILVQRVEAIAPELLRDNKAMPETNEIPVAYLQTPHYASLRVN